MLGFPGYEVSDAGNVRSARSSYKRGPGSPPLAMHPTTCRGYLFVTLMRDKKPHRYGVHRLVAAAFHGPRPTGLVCRHLDGNGLNNRASNLKWGTYKENSQDTIDHGRQSFGERHVTAKITNDQAEQIKANRGFLTAQHLAEVFDISPSAVRSICDALSWRRVTGEDPKEKKPLAPFATVKSYGSKHRNARLNETAAKAIFLSTERSSVLAERYGVTVHTIDSIWCGRGWVHATSNLSRPSRRSRLHLSKGQAK